MAAAHENVDTQMAILASKLKLNENLAISVQGNILTITWKKKLFTITIPLSYYNRSHNISDDNATEIYVYNHLDNTNNIFIEDSKTLVLHYINDCVAGVNFLTFYD